MTQTAVTDTNLLRFRAAVAGALAHLESRRQEVNDLNVFPVADGDTGDNMVLTLRAVLDELDRLQGADADTHDRRDRPRGDRAVGGARRAAGRARELRRDPLAADPRRRRGAGLAPRRADRRDADRRRARQRRRRAPTPRCATPPRARSSRSPARWLGGSRPTSNTIPTAPACIPTRRPRCRTTRSRRRSTAPSTPGRSRSGAARSCSRRCATPASSTPAATA